MVKEYTTDTDVATMLDNYDFYFISVNNPDGYAWSWTDVSAADTTQYTWTECNYTNYMINVISSAHMYKHGT